MQRNTHQIKASSNRVGLAALLGRGSRDADAGTPVRGVRAAALVRATRSACMHRTLLPVGRVWRRERLHGGMKGCAGRRAGLLQQHLGLLGLDLLLKKHQLLLDHLLLRVLRRPRRKGTAPANRRRHRAGVARAGCWGERRPLCDLSAQGGLGLRTIRCGSGTCTYPSFGASFHSSGLSLMA